MIATSGFLTALERTKFVFGPSAGREGQGKRGEGKGTAPLRQIPGSSPVLPARHVRPQPGLTTVLGRVTSERLVIVSSQHMICTELQF